MNTNKRQQTARISLNSSLRNRIHSLKKMTSDISNQEDEQIVQLLKKDFQSENNKQQQPVSQIKHQIPGFQQIHVENKLWNYFLQKAKKLANKVQKQQLNCWVNNYFSIRKQVRKRLQNGKSSIANIQQTIKQKYKKISQIFQEIKNDKITKNHINANLKNKKNKKQVQQISKQNQIQKIDSLKQQVKNIRLHTISLQEQLNQLNKQHQKLKSQWIQFNKNFIKNGFYLKNGIQSIFLQLIQFKQDINESFLPQFCDPTTKFCLKNYYQSLKKQNRNNTGLQNQSQILINTKKSSISNISKLRYISQQKSLRNIYSSTQEYMGEWIKQSKWKQELVLPKIKIQKQIQNNTWKQDQLKRMKYAYTDKNIYNNIRCMIFGSKLQTIQ